eukprot:TRINITY_DN4089_c0_g1_i2.p1 TRINITY_DN4089_c0_g1~~TRINITY_DN4089_c0_g1_i2.p1  ORF type:complete len:301 (+),score=66.11 TRINITY_DN4089_c0_g1_i2:256-1158(+)
MDSVIRIVGEFSVTTLVLWTCGWTALLEPFLPAIVIDAALLLAACLPQALLAFGLLEDGWDERLMDLFLLANQFLFQALLEGVNFIDVSGVLFPLLMRRRDALETFLTKFLVYAQDPLCHSSYKKSKKKGFRASSIHGCHDEGENSALVGESYALKKPQLTEGTGLETSSESGAATPFPTAAAGDGAPTHQNDTRPLAKPSLEEEDEANTGSFRIQSPESLTSSSSVKGGGESPGEDIATETGGSADSFPQLRVRTIEDDEEGQGDDEAHEIFENAPTEIESDEHMATPLGSFTNVTQFS